MFIDNKSTTVDQIETLNMRQPMKLQVCMRLLPLTINDNMWAGLTPLYTLNYYD